MRTPDCWFWLVLIFSLPGCSLAENKSKSYQTAEQQAYDLSDVFSSRPVHVRATIHSYGLLTVEGSYELIQASKDQLREQVRTPNFSEIRFNNHGEWYIARSKIVEPLPIARAVEVIRGARIIARDAPISEITNSHESGADARCYRTLPVQPGRFTSYEACFDVRTGSLVSWSSGFNNERQRFEYSNFQQDGNKMFPWAMRFYKNGKLLSEVIVEALSHEVPEDAAHVFDPPTNAVKLESCKKLERAEPQYTGQYFNLRSDSKAEGKTVVLAGTLDDRGRPANVEIQQSADERTDKLALQAVNELHPKAAKCDGKATPSLFRLQIWFSPVFHPDSFESFR